MKGWSLISIAATPNTSRADRPRIDGPSGEVPVDSCRLLSLAIAHGGRKIACAIDVLSIERLSRPKIGRAALPPGPLATTGFLTRACSIQHRLLGTEWRTTSTTFPILLERPMTASGHRPLVLRLVMRPPSIRLPFALVTRLPPESCPIVFIVLPYPSVEISC